MKEIDRYPKEGDLVLRKYYHDWFILKIKKFKNKNCNMNKIKFKLFEYKVLHKHTSAKSLIFNNFCFPSKNHGKTCKDYFITEDEAIVMMI